MGFEVNEQSTRDWLDGKGRTWLGLMESFDQFDEIQLLALIEGELSAGDENRLLAKLESNPQVRARVMQMRENRTDLGNVPEIDLPRDFLIDLEPLLARPMLLDPNPTPRKPGEYRRRHDRANQQIPRRRYAAVAMILLMLIGGIWAVSSGQAGRGINAVQALLFDQEEMLPDRLQIEDIASQVAIAESPDWTIEDGILHHYLPEMVPLPLLVSVDNMPASLSNRSNEKIIANFAIVVQTSDKGLFEQSMSDLLPRFDKQIALVRNHTAALQRNERTGSTPSLAPRNAAGSGNRRNADHQRSSELNEFMRPDFKPLRSGQALGRGDFCPSREQQIGFDVLGASHPLCIKSIRVNELLGQVATLKHFSTQLMMIQREGQTVIDLTARSSSQTLADLRKIREAMAGLTEHGDGAVVMIPVIFQD